MPGHILPVMSRLLPIWSCMWNRAPCWITKKCKSVRSRGYRVFSGRMSLWKARPITPEPRPRPCGMTRDLPQRGQDSFCASLPVRTGTLATVGSLRLEPGLINVVPGKAVFSVDMRDPDADRLAAAQAEFAAFLPRLEQEEGVRVSSRVLVNFAPVAFAPAVIDRVEAAAQRQGFSCRRMVSGAGHDAQMMARICPTGMMFVPSRAGLSHCPQEFTGPEDLRRGVLTPAGNGSGSAGCGRYRHKMSVASGAEPVFSKIWKDGLRSRSEQKRRYAEATGQIR